MTGRVLRQVKDIEVIDAGLWLTLRAPGQAMTYAALRAVLSRVNGLRGSKWTTQDMRHTRAVRVLEIIANLKDRIPEGWEQLGEVEGLQVGLSGAEHNLVGMQQQLDRAEDSVVLGLPKVPIRAIAEDTP